MVAARTVPRWQLGREIAAMMAKAGVDQVVVARYLEARQSRVAHILKGTTTVTTGDLQLLIQKLGFADAPQEYLDWLGELRRKQTQRGFWNTGPNRTYQERVRFLLEAEREALEISAVYVEEVPSLLQTEAYVRARLDQAALAERGVTEDEAVEAWKQRQSHLTRKKRPLRYQAILSDSCLRNEFGGPQVMEEVIESLIEWQRRPNVQIQIVPSRGRTVRMGSSYQLATVPGHDQALAGSVEFAVVENPDGMNYIDDPDAVFLYRRRLLELAAAAPRPDDSVAILRSVQDTFRSRAF